MKKLIFVLSMLTIAFAGAASAADWWQDNVGIYTDAGEYNIALAPFTTINLHMIITNSTAAEISGFELKLVSEGPGLLGDRFIDHDHINAATRVGEFAVGFGTPQPFVGGSFELMHFELTVMDDAAPVYLYIDQIYFSSDGGSMPLFVCDGDFVSLHQSLGLATDPVFLANSILEPVATESTSFDGLKSLYR